MDFFLYEKQAGPWLCLSTFCAPIVDPLKRKNNEKNILVSQAHFTDLFIKTLGTLTALSFPHTLFCFSCIFSNSPHHLITNYSLRISCFYCFLSSNLHRFHWNINSRVQESLSAPLPEESQVPSRRLGHNWHSIK